MTIKREIRDKRKKYFNSSKRLRELSAPFGDYTDTQCKVMRAKQKEFYDKWRFYDGLIKASEKESTTKEKQNWKLFNV